MSFPALKKRIDPQTSKKTKMRRRSRWYDLSYVLDALELNQKEYLKAVRGYEDALSRPQKPLSLNQKKRHKKKGREQRS